MSDDQNTENVPEDIKDDVGNVPASPLVIHRQYLKDLSFESPNSPQLLVRTNQPPEVEMDIMLDVQRLADPDHDHFYEVVLQVTGTAKRNDDTLFIAEVIYAATASIQGIDEKNHHPILFIEVPQIIFPFTRQIMSHITLSGGFAPINLQPVDFRNMYLQRFAQKQAKNMEAEAKNA